MINIELALAVRKAGSFATLSVAMAGLLLANVGLAQQSSGLVIEEIIVTAQKREASLKDVPISIAAMGADTIKETGIRRLSEISEYIPNLEINDEGRTTITMRGVGSSSRNIGFDSRVGVYIDGVYVGQSAAANQDILDLERIEVLRGPQGTLFGKNSIAGAISMITNKPADERDVDITLSAGNFNHRRLTGTIDLPLGDKVFTKFAVNHQARDGYYTNIPTGKDGETEGTSYRAQLRTALTDSIEMNISLDRFDEDSEGSSSRIIGTDFGLFVPNIEPFTANDNFFPWGQRELRGGALTFDWALSNDFTLKSITGYRSTYSHGKGDLDGGFDWAPALGGLDFVFGMTSETETDFEDEYTQWSQEFQLISPSDQDLQYVAGLYIYGQEAVTDRRAISHNDPSHPFYAGGMLPFPGDTFFTIITTGLVDTRSYAAFINGSYRFTDRLTVGLGARYSDETKDVDWRSTVDETGGRDLVLGGILHVGVDGFGFPEDATLVDSRSDTYFSPELSVKYAINDNLNSYYRVSTGYKSGGYNLDFITQAAFDAGLEFDKETVLSHEIGLKGDFYDRRVVGGLSVFQADYEDYQVQQFLEAEAGAAAVAAVIRNAAEVRTRGLEIEVEALILEGWTVTASAGFLDAEFVDFPGGSTDDNGQPINLKGNTVGGSPKNSFNLGTQYNLTLDSLNAEALFRIDYAYLGEKFSDGNNVNEKERILADGTVLQDYLYSENSERLNARIGLMAADGGWSVSLWGRNLTDENDTISSFSVFPSYQRRDSLPRTYGIDVGFHF